MIFYHISTNFHTNVYFSDSQQPFYTEINVYARSYFPLRLLLLGQVRSICFVGMNADYSTFIFNLGGLPEVIITRLALPDIWFRVSPADMGLKVPLI